MNTFPKTYYWLILTGIVSGILTGLVFAELIDFRTWYGGLFGLMTPGLFLTMFNSFVLREINPPKRNIFLITLFGGLLTFLVYLSALLIAWILMFSMEANQHITVSIIGLTTAMIARSFFGIQFNLPKNRWNLTAFALTGFCSGLVFIMLEEGKGFLGYDIFGNMPIGVLLSYTLFTVLFNVCLILSAFTKYVKVVHITYLLVLFMLTADIFLHIYFW